MFTFVKNYKSVPSTARLNLCDANSSLHVTSNILLTVTLYLLWYEYSLEISFAAAFQGPISSSQFYKNAYYIVEYLPR